MYRKPVNASLPVVGKAYFYNVIHFILLYALNAHRPPGPKAARCSNEPCEGSVLTLVDYTADCFLIFYLKYNFITY